MLGLLLGAPRAAPAGRREPGDLPLERRRPGLLRGELRRELADAGRVPVEVLR